jgi:hypothetical protein
VKRMFYAAGCAPCLISGCLPSLPDDDVGDDDPTGDDDASEGAPAVTHIDGDAADARPVEDLDGLTDDLPDGIPVLPTPMMPPCL